MPMAKKIFLVDDDVDLREALASQLNLYEEYETSEAGTGAEALAALKTDNVDIIILDVGLPDLDGREVCRMIRRIGVKVPIIMLTGADTDSDTILGLDAGANDYITKPFRFEVLLARLRAHLRQHEQSEDAIFAIGPYTFKPSAKVLIHGEGGQKVRLTEKETSILKYLFRAGERPVSRDDLLNDVWGYNAGVTTHTLETHIYRLRQKIEENPAEARILLTEPGGYRLDATSNSQPATA
ncbi:MAG: response regulator transcription factor [Proteobacteria bacterium]|nr:response regulator transcription factor [Pseudomonadota bacterium]